mmetsp:Transcript_33269/g.69952  ORF Transcript_33269/g.69952 Transcript_33269/m.69952 type:complete len:87 (+) Transcript_33269:33-293(+)
MVLHYFAEMAISTQCNAWAGHITSTSAIIRCDIDSSIATSTAELDYDSYCCQRPYRSKNDAIDTRYGQLTAALPIYSRYGSCVDTR